MSKNFYLIMAVIAYSMLVLDLAYSKEGLDLLLLAMSTFFTFSYLRSEVENTDGVVIDIKVLMYRDVYVDFNRLNNGIYETKKPFFYTEYSSIEDLASACAEAGLSQSLIDNLRLCSLSTFKLVGSKYKQ